MAQLYQQAHYAVHIIRWHLPIATSSTSAMLYLQLSLDVIVSQVTGLGKTLDCTMARLGAAHRQHRVNCWCWQIAGLC